MTELNINRKEIPIGEVAYYIKNTNTPYKYDIGFGIVEEHYSSEIVLELYTPREMRIVNGIPYNEFNTPTEWKKLPKGWTYSTELFTLDWVKPENNMELLINNPEHIKEAIDRGLLIKAINKDYSHIEAEIDAQKGYRLLRRIGQSEYHPFWISRPYREVYVTYAEAKAEIDRRYAELKRQAELSDYDWSVEQIDNTIKKGVKLGYITEQEGEEYRNRLLNMENVEDIETRICYSSMQWKYWKNKRWINLK